MLLNHETIKCPLWSDHPIYVQDKIDTEDVVWLYRHCHGMDISNEFSSSQLFLMRDPDTDFAFFHPLVSGSASFYRQLYDRLGYHWEKPEFKWASAFVKPGDRVLDVGCGWGAFRRYVPAADYRGLETNESSAQEGRRQGVRVDTLGVEEAAQSGETYNVVTAFQVLEHVDDPLGFFRASVRLVQEGGLLIFSVPNINSYMSIRENVSLNLPPHHLTWWGLRTFIKLGIQEGMTLIDYNEEELVSLAHFAESFFKTKINALLRRQSRIICRSKIDRALNKGLNYVGRFLTNPPAAIAPKGHSLTVVLRKNT